MIIDGENLVLGRLASFAAKKAILGEEVVIVNSEKVIITGSKRDILKKYKRKIEMGDVTKGPFFPRGPERILRRTIRGMLPYKKDKGRKAYRRVKCFLGVPEDYKEKYKNSETISKFNIAKLKNLKYLSLKEVSKELGVKV